MEKIKLLHIITRLDKGGSAQTVFLILRALKKQNFQSALISGLSLESEMRPEEIKAVEKDIRRLESDGVELVHCSSLVRRINIAKDLRALLSLRRIIKKTKPLIVHTHTSKAGFLGRLAARLSGIPVIVHTPHGHIFYGYFGRFKTKVFIILERLASRLTDKIVALTEREKEDYLLFKIAKEDKFFVIHSGVELKELQELSSEEKQDFKKELGVPENSFIVGTVGRLVPVKGPEFLVEAAKHIIPNFPRTYFLFTGDGYLRASLEEQALKLGIQKNIIFLGWREDVVKIISLFDIFALPSLNEGMGRVLVEAMALEKPIVASHVGGIPDLITHGKNGFLVPPKNPGQLAKYIRLLIEDKGKRKRIGQQGKKTAQNFSKEVMVEKVTELYRKLMIQKGI
jgi:glycosyltransferase involved in cell wall biosynthesis